MDEETGEKGASDERIYIEDNVLPSSDNFSTPCVFKMTKPLTYSLLVATLN